MAACSWLDRSVKSQTKLFFKVPLPVCVEFICLFYMNVAVFIDNSSADQSHTATVSLPPTKNVEDKEKLEVEDDGKVFFLRRSNRVAATPAETDSDNNDDDDDDNIDKEHVQRFFLDEDNDEIDDDDDEETLKMVERKCPYCPDRFHNGIGLANHVRGHLNRVGVSYNVRHFISPEEVNAIEKKFSYQKKKKKGQQHVAFNYLHCIDY